MCLFWIWFLKILVGWFLLERIRAVLTAAVLEQASCCPPPASYWSFTLKKGVVKIIVEDSQNLGSSTSVFASRPSCGIRYCLIPSEAPGSVAALANKNTSSTNGNMAVRYATFKKMTVIISYQLIPAELCFQWDDLAHGSDTFPDTEEAEEPAEQKTQSQLWSDAAQLLHTSRHSQEPPSEETEYFILFPSWFHWFLNQNVILDCFIYTKAAFTHSQNWVAADVGSNILVSFAVWLAASKSQTSRQLSEIKFHCKFIFPNVDSIIKKPSSL